MRLTLRGRHSRAREAARAAQTPFALERGYDGTAPLLAVAAPIVAAFLAMLSLFLKP